MHNCTHYPELVMANYESLELKLAATLTDEDIEHLQQIAAQRREHRLSRSAFSDLCQSDLD